MTDITLYPFIRCLMLYSRSLMYVDLGQSKHERTYKTFDEVHVILLMMVKL